MKTEIITESELAQYNLSVPYEQSFLDTLKSFMENGDKESVLHVTLDNHISTERQRIRRLQKMFPEFNGLKFKFKTINEVGHAFITVA
jgi:hypothetical protein